MGASVDWTRLGIRFLGRMRTVWAGAVGTAVWLPHSGGSRHWVSALGQPECPRAASLLGLERLTVGTAERTRIPGSKKQSCQTGDELSSDPGRRSYCPVLSVSVLRGPAWTRGSGGTDSLDRRVSRSHCLGTRALGEMEAAVLGTKSRHIFSSHGFSFPCLRPRSVRFGNDSPYGAGA